MVPGTLGNGGNAGGPTRRAGALFLGPLAMFV